MTDGSPPEETRQQPECEPIFGTEEKWIEDSEEPKGSLKLRVLPKIQEKTKRILHVRNEKEERKVDAALSLIEDDPAFSPSKLASSQKVDQMNKKIADGTSHQKASGILRSIANGIIHPKETIKSKVTKATAAKLSDTQRPYLSQEADLEFLDAHKEAGSARPSSRRTVSNISQPGSLNESCEAKFHEMKAYRESLQVAWTMNRHVSRVRVVPQRHMEFRDLSYFAKRDTQGRLVRFDILKWLGYVRASIYHFPMRSKTLTPLICIESHLLYARLQFALY